MADSTVSALPAAAALSGPELLYGVQSAADVKVTATQMRTFAATGLATLGANTFTALQTITQASANAGILASTGYSLTGANTTSMIDLAGTLNTSGSPDVVALRITDTARGASTTFVNLYGGAGGASSAFKIDRLGNVTFGLLGASAVGTLSVGAGDMQIVTGASNSIYIRHDTNYGLSMHSSLPIGWALNGSNAVPDTSITRKGAANIQFGKSDAAAPVAQTLSVQSVVAGTSNTAGADFTIAGSQGTGTGVGGNIVFKTAPAGTTGTAQNALAEVLRIVNTGNILLTGSGANTVLLSPKVNSVLEVLTSGGAYTSAVLSGSFRASSATGTAILASIAATTLNVVVPSGLGLASTQPIMWVSSSTDVYTGTGDLFLTRKGAANLRFGAADAAAPVAQTLSVQSVVAGTSNTAGADWNITGSLSTGNGIAGKIIFNLSQIVAAATTQNASSPVITLSNVAATGIQFNGYGAGAITSDGSGNLTAASDERMKHVLGDFTDGLAELENIQPIIYRWRADSGMEPEHEYAGFAAGNVKNAIPMATGITPDGYMTLQDRALLAACVNAIKQLAKEVRH